MGFPNIFFTADYHIGHRRILGLGKGRPFASLDEMASAIADRHNAVVRPGDLVYNVGDYALMVTWEQALAFRRRLLGNQFFLRGNHDSVAEEMFRREPSAFVWMRDLETLKPKNYGVPQITLCHYAMRTWPGSHGGSWMLYGHSHGMLPEVEGFLTFDVGVDCWNFSPVSIEEVKQKMARKQPAREAYKASLEGTGRAE